MVITKIKYYLLAIVINIFIQKKRLAHQDALTEQLDRQNDRQSPL